MWAALAVCVYACVYAKMLAHSYLCSSYNQPNLRYSIPCGKRNSPTVPPSRDCWCLSLSLARSTRGQLNCVLFDGTRNNVSPSLQNGRRKVPLPADNTQRTVGLRVCMLKLWSGLCMLYILHVEILHMYIRNVENINCEKTINAALRGFFIDRQPGEGE